MYYQGGVSTNKITNGRNMDWGAISSININGTVNIINSLQIGGSDYYYYLFNNTGGRHGDINGDFNNVGNFGCKFVNGATNGPGTP
jgi:hypothetical protein